MFELTIKGTVYRFNFGMGFLREVNKRVTQPVDNIPDVKKNIGLRYKIAGVIDKDLEELVDTLDCANKGEEPRVTKALLDAYIDDEETDIDELFESVIDFLKKANATKTTTEELLKDVEQQKELMKRKMEREMMM